MKIIAKNLLMTTVLILSPLTIAKETKTSVIEDGPSCGTIRKVLNNKNSITLQKQALILKLKDPKFRKLIRVEVEDIRLDDEDKKVVIEGKACGLKNLNIKGYLVNPMHEILDWNINKGYYLHLEFFGLSHAIRTSRGTVIHLIGNFEFIESKGLELDVLPDEISIDDID